MAETPKITIGNWGTEATLHDLLEVNQKILVVVTAILEQMKK